jgi:hypothetical protein
MTTVCVLKLVRTLGKTLTLSQGKDFNGRVLWVLTYLLNLPDAIYRQYVSKLETVKNHYGHQSYVFKVYYDRILGVYCVLILRINITIDAHFQNVLDSNDR